MQYALSVMFLSFARMRIFWANSFGRVRVIYSVVLPVAGLPAPGLAPPRFDPDIDTSVYLN